MLMIVSFTKAGTQLNRKLTKALQEQDYACQSYALSKFAEGSAMISVEEGMGAFIEKMWTRTDGIVFIGAVGMVVRLVAPFVRHMHSDPAVLVIDEKGQFVIPLLSGHAGGTNELAEGVAAWLGAIPVITAETEEQEKFAVDVWEAAEKVQEENVE